MPRKFSPVKMTIRTMLMMKPVVVTLLVFGLYRAGHQCEP